jgi:hypothetical protein
MSRLNGLGATAVPCLPDKIQPRKAQKGLDEFSMLTIGE